MIVFHFDCFSVRRVSLQKNTHLQPWSRCMGIPTVSETPWKDTWWSVKFYYLLVEHAYLIWVVQNYFRPKIGFFVPPPPWGETYCWHPEKFRYQTGKRARSAEFFYPAMFFSRKRVCEKFCFNSCFFYEKMFFLFFIKDLLFIFELVCYHIPLIFEISSSNRFWFSKNWCLSLAKYNQAKDTFVEYNISSVQEQPF